MIHQQRSTAPSPARRCLQLGLAPSQNLLSSRNFGFCIAHRPQVWLTVTSSLLEGPASSSDRIFGDTKPGSLASQVPALHDRRHVGTVIGEDAFEHVPRLIWFLGYDEEPVLVAAAGRADVEAPVAGGFRDDGEADVDGVGLVAVGSSRVAQPDVLACVIRVDGHSPVSVEMRQGDAAVGVDAGDCPSISVADSFTALRSGGAVVAPCHDEVADGRCLTTCDTDGLAAELTVGAALVLDGGVQSVDVLVGLGNHCDASAGGGVVNPAASGVAGKVGEGAGGDTAVRKVGVERLGAPGA